MEEVVAPRSDPTATATAADAAAAVAAADGDGAGDGGGARDLASVHANTLREVPVSHHHRVHVLAFVRHAAEHHHVTEAQLLCRRVLAEEVEQTLFVEALASPELTISPLGVRKNKGA